MTLILSETQQAIVRELAERRAQQAKLKRQCDDLRNEILQSLAVEDGAVVGAGSDAVVRGLDEHGKTIVTVTPEVRNRINSAKVHALFPEVYDECTETSVVTVVRTP